MPSVRYEIPGSCTDLFAPVLGYGDVLTHGTLMHIEPGRDGLSAVPTVGGVIKNHAAGIAAGLVGADANDLHASVLSNTLTSTTGRMELTSKGGLHGMMRLVTGVQTLAYTIDMLPPAIAAYIAANPTHAYYFDMLIRVTRAPNRAAGGGIRYNAYVAAGGTSTTQILVAPMAQDTDSEKTYSNYMVPSGSQSRRSFAQEVNLTTGSILHPAIATSGELPQAGWPSSNTPVGRLFWSPPANTTLLGGASFITYTAHVSDLTVAGRTPAQQAAAMAALKDVYFGTGGRYAGDTYTDPAGITWS